MVANPTVNLLELGLYEYVDTEGSASVIIGFDDRQDVFAADGADTVYGDGTDTTTETKWHGGDLIDGGAGNDLIFGQGGDDELRGDLGLDTLLGGGGADWIDGGADADSIEGGDGHDVITGGAGRDTVFGGAGDDSIQGGADTSADSLIGDSGNDTLDGGAGNDILNAGAGNDLLVVGSGLDTVIGGLDNDTIVIAAAGALSLVDGGAGSDLLDLSAGTQAVSLDFTAGGGAGTIGGGFTSAPANVSLGSFEGMIGTAFADTFIGDSSDEYFQTAASGGSGFDRFMGGGGNDTLIWVGSANSWAPFGGDAGVDGGAGNDLISFLNSTMFNFFVNLNLASQSVGGIGLTNFEFIQAGIGGETLIGTAGANWFSGEGGADWLVGGGGLDTLLGGGMNDTLVGGADNDSLAGGDGDDAMYSGGGDSTLDGGGGFDTVFLQGGSGAPSVTHQGGTTGLGTDVWSRIEAVVGNVLADRIDFSGAGMLAGSEFPAFGGASYILQGGAGDDTLIGSADRDNLEGGADNDDLAGGAGNDTLRGGAGHDVLRPGSGVDAAFGEDGDDAFDLNDVADLANDTIHGGNGNDVADLFEGALQLGTTLPFVALERLDTWNTAMRGTPDADSYDFTPLAATAFGEGWFFQLAAGAGADTVRTGDADSGGAAHLIALEAGDDLFLGGAQVDEVAGGDDADTVSGGGGDDALQGDAGDDRLQGDLGNDRLSGGLGNDMLAGDVGADTLLGADGADTLDGGAGADTMVGGNGDDVFVLDDVGDRILDVAGGGTDHVFAPFSYNLTTLTGQEIENLTLTGTGGISAAGNALANRLVGNVAGNVLNGGAGADTMAGGNGNDTYVVDNAGDRVVEVAGGGVDHVLTSVSYNLTTQAAGQEIENLTLTGTGGISAAGNALANRLVGNVAGNVLNGGTGADTMEGGNGNDTYVVDNIGDKVLEAAGGGVDGVQASVTYSLAALIGQEIENLTLIGSGAIGGTGNALANRVTGNGAANLLQGLDGADTLDGGIGADTLDGGNGDDLLVVDEAGDRVTEAAGGGADTVQAGVTFSLAVLAGQEVETLVLTGAASLDGTGNGLANRILGNGAANLLQGLDGADTLDGGAGADTLVGGNGDDVFIVDNTGDRVTEAAGGGIDHVFTSVSYNLTAQTGQQIENLTLTGTGGTSAAGNALANRLVGNGAGNVLNGGAGADTMEGGAGNDTYMVDNAGDRVVEVAGGGVDSVQSSVSYNLTTQAAGQEIENLTLTGTAGISAAGNSLANRLVGNVAGNVLNGGTGADTMEGGAGNDTYVVDNIGDKVVEAVGGGVDSVQASVTFSLTGQEIENLTLTGSGATNGTGNALANRLTGNGAANLLQGLDGADTLTGIGAADTLDGGAGADSFLFGEAPAAGQADRIIDFSVADDTILLAASAFAGLPVGVLAAGAFVIGAAAADASDRIIYDSATGALLHDADGTGAAAPALLIATLSTGLILTAADIVVV